MSEKRVLSFDFGASGGRAMLCSFDGEKITLKELHRFENNPVMVGKTFYWDILRLFHEIKQGIVKAKNDGGFDSIGIDTWGVDFGLIDKDGRLLDNPVHYRDRRTDGLAEKSFRLLDREQFYKITGIQFMDINTVFQLMAVKRDRPDLLKRADKLLLMPDLFNFLLTGEVHAEYSIASTTQMMNATNGIWSDTVLKALGIPRNILPDIIPSGSRAGMLSDDICEELEVPKVPVFAVCGHDTQCAAAAVPTEEDDFIFISCGTWSLFGTELDEPVLTERSAELSVSNEGGYGGKTTLLKNIIGLWLIQESRRQWIREGSEYSYADLERLALEAEPMVSFIDPDAPEFTPQGNIPERVRDFCRRTNQPVPETVGEIMRCIYQSLALKYRQAFDEIRTCTGREYRSIHLIGGGTKDGLLCKMTASACDCTVYAGPAEATVFGNAAIQFISHGDIPDIKTARKIIAASDEIKSYSPENTEEWQVAFEVFKNFVK